MTQPTAFLVDDDEAVRDSLAWTLKREGVQVETYATPCALLKAYDTTRFGCLILDLRLPEMNGLELRRRLVEIGCELPFIVISGHGDIPSAKNAMQLGALDFMEKPIDREVLLDWVWQAFDTDERRRHDEAEYAYVQDRLNGLTDREREVLDLVVDAKLTKQISRQLRISIKTVEAHRSHITKKMHVVSTVQLVRMVTEHYLSHTAPTKHPN